jgi:hypothetical protein
MGAGFFGGLLNDTLAPAINRMTGGSNLGTIGANVLKDNMPGMFDQPPKTFLTPQEQVQQSRANGGILRLRGQQPNPGQMPTVPMDQPGMFGSERVAAPVFGYNDSSNPTVPMDQPGMFGSERVAAPVFGYNDSSNPTVPMDFGGGYQPEVGISNITGFDENGLPIGYSTFASDKNTKFSPGQQTPQQGPTGETLGQPMANNQIGPSFNVGGATMGRFADYGPTVDVNRPAGQQPGQMPNPGSIGQPGGYQDPPSAPSGQLQQPKTFLTPQEQVQQPIQNMGGPYTPRPDLGPNVGFGPGLPNPQDNNNYNSNGFMGGSMPQQDNQQYYQQMRESMQGMDKALKELEGIQTPGGKYNTVGGMGQGSAGKSGK